MSTCLEHNQKTEGKVPKIMECCYSSLYDQNPKQAKVNYYGLMTRILLLGRLIRSSRGLSSSHRGLAPIISICVLLFF